MHCILCGDMNAKTLNSNDDYIDIFCPNCGKYSISTHHLKNKKLIQAFCYYMLNEKPANKEKICLGENKDINKNNDVGSEKVLYISEDIILTYYPNDFSQHVDKVLLNLSRVYPDYGDKIDLNTYRSENYFLHERLGKFIFINSAIPVDDSIYYQKIKGFFNLLVDMDYLTRINETRFSISSKGWLRVYEIQKSLKRSKQAFVAMWFDPQMNNIWLKIKEAVNDSGYIPIRIDEKEHNNQIVPEIKYEIKRSAFVIADLTGNRNGVYYEAGYAEALDKEVIVTWKKTDEQGDKPHFDIAQKSMIQYTNEDELYKSLLRRIEATVGMADSR